MTANKTATLETFPQTSIFIPSHCKLVALDQGRRFSWPSQMDILCLVLWSMPFLPAILKIAFNVKEVETFEFTNSTLLKF